MIFSVREKPLIGLTAYAGEEILKFLKEANIESLLLTAGDFFTVDAGTLPSMATFIAVNTIVIIQMQTG
ncbi:hypothetical protein LSTR_LSTR004667 [Laodelphax striatellus]|uniref:Uncharacterized protein n=1 Tax=Laodelphax striatellus TaxID=195883 RepID=A0A482WTP8_LAOST|nr:hypothetical protein LSTR_LSTR004667 [Laodelphax striatellus]